MKTAIIAAYVTIAWGGAGAQTSPWQPAPGHAQVPIWPGAAPGARPVADSEKAGPVQGHTVAGRPWTYVSNVSRPTYTVYAPKGRNTGAAIVVFPGGGYQILAIDLEGTEVCDWLTSRGITCVLLKYRVPRSGPSWQPDCRCQINPKPQPALQDAQRTMGLVRLHAAEWHVDPHRIGVLGFSAGGYLAAEISTKYQHRLYAAIDDADKESARPDFAVLVYPGHLATGDKAGQLPTVEKGLNPNVPVTAETPPTFLMQAEDDNIDGVSQVLVYNAALQKAGVKVEMHLYVEGGHAFGLRHTAMPITDWPRLAETWLHPIGMTPE